MCSTIFNETNRKLVSIIAAIMIFVSCFAFFTPIKSQAASNSYLRVSNGHVRIYNQYSRKYLGIDKAENDNYGAWLKIRNEQYGNQSQIFYIAYRGTINGNPVYQLRVHGGNNMIIAVRDASKRDGAEIVQITDNGNNQRHGLWYICRTNTNEVRFQNVYSGKMLNIYGGYTKEGTKLIQWPSEWGWNEMFTIKWLNKSDILGATWTRDFYSSGVGFNTIRNANTAARQHYASPWTAMVGTTLYYPAPSRGERLAAVVYLSSEETAQILLAKDPPTSTVNSLWDTIKSEGTEMMLDAVLSKCGIKIPIPSGMLLGWANTVYGLEYTKRWNDFKRFVQNNGGSVKISIYYSFELVNGISYMPVLNTKIRVAYSSWNGRICYSNFSIKNRHIAYSIY